MVNENNKNAMLSGILKNSNLSGNSRGFTLIELLLVTAILGILSTIAVSGYTGFREQAKIAVCGSEIRGLVNDISAYALEKGAFPAAATWLSDIGRAGLVDPWGHPYVYALAGTRTLAGPINSDYDLYSKGSDGDTAPQILNPKSTDDIIRANDGAYIGLASKY